MGYEKHSLNVSKLAYEQLREIRDKLSVKLQRTITFSEAINYLYDNQRLEIE